MKVNLNRSEGLTLDENTPYDVIIFLMKTSGKLVDREMIDKKFEKVKKFLRSHESWIEISDSYTKEDLEKITMFVSDTEDPWMVKNLLRSLKHVLKFKKKPDLSEGYQVGSKKNNSPMSLDISMIYRINLLLGNKVGRDDTMETLCDNLSHLKFDRKEMTLKIFQNLEDLSNLDLHQLSKSLKSEPVETDLESLSKKININYIINRSILSDEESVIYAFKFYSYDISESKDPSLFLRELCSQKPITEIDEFTKNFGVNKKYYKIEKFWKPRVSYLYSPKNLQVIKKYEGVETEDELNSLWNKDNFYDGMIDFENPVDGEEIITYGCVSERRYETFSVEDLERKLQRDLGFGKFSERIPKLVTISKENGYENLLNLIARTNKYYSDLDSKTRKLKDLDDNETREAKTFFTSIYELSELFKDKEEITDLENLSIVNSISEIFQHLGESKNTRLRDILSSLPIYIYNDEKFIRCRENYYDTIYEDIKSLKNLKDKNRAFLKTKQKYYSETAYFYIFFVSGEKIFDIGDMKPDLEERM